MFFRFKIFFIFSFFLATLVLSAQDVSSMKSEAQTKAGKISDIEAELQKMNAEAVSTKDIKWKVCLDSYLGAVKGMAASAVNIAAKIPELIDAGMVSDAQSQLILLNGLADSAEKSLADSQGCERQFNDSVQNSNSTLEKKDDSPDSVTAAVTVNSGENMPTEIDRGKVSGSNLSDAAEVDESDFPQSPNDKTGQSLSELPEDVPKEDVSPAM